MNILKKIKSLETQKQKLVNLIFNSSLSKLEQLKLISNSNLLPYAPYVQHHDFGQLLPQNAIIDDYFRLQEYKRYRKIDYYQELDYIKDQLADEDSGYVFGEKCILVLQSREWNSDITKQVSVTMTPEEFENYIYDTVKESRTIGYINDW